MNIMDYAERNQVLLRDFKSGKLRHISCVVDAGEHNMCRRFLVRKNKTLVEMMRKMVARYAREEAKFIGEISNER